MFIYCYVLPVRINMDRTACYIAIIIHVETEFWRIVHVQMVVGGLALYCEYLTLKVYLRLIIYKPSYVDDVARLRDAAALELEDNPLPQGFSGRFKYKSMFTNFVKVDARKVNCINSK